jgi:5-methylcytosine-specific restriction endonuclease McrA
MKRHCPYCGRRMYQHGETPRRPKGMPRPAWRATHKRLLATRDHIVPASRGGAGQRTVRVCHECNQEKGALSLAEYRAVRRVRYGTWFFAYERLIPSALLDNALLWASKWALILGL